MTRLRILFCLLAAAILCATIVAVPKTPAQRPKTLIQLTMIRWGPGAAPEVRRAALEGIERAAESSTGVRNLWLRTIRLQPRDFMTAFAIEFEDSASLERFQSSPAMDKWRRTYFPYIDELRIQEVGN